MRKNGGAERQYGKIYEGGDQAGEKAAAIGEVPIGCVIVRGGTILARGYNRRNIEGSTLAHAEIIAIKKASKKLQDWRLEDCELYVTLEPCPMCAGAIVQARIPKVVIGAMNPKAGCAGSILDLLQEKRFNHQVDKVIGVLQEQCSQMMQDFFGNCAGRKKRKRTILTGHTGIYIIKFVSFL